MVGFEGRIPRRLGPYVLERELARGGMGAVYVARHEQLGRRVALKVLLDRDRESVQRFAVEARATARLRHSNIVAIHEVGQDQGVPFLTMDLIEGSSLAQLLREQGPFEPREAVRIVEAMARAVAHAHEALILHRDLKPANVLIDASGEPRVTDFGLAKLVDRRSQALTETGSVMGTPAYMAPEQAGGQTDQVGIGSDVYALGACLYALLTGRPPFVVQGVVQLLARVMTADPEPPSKHRTGVPAALDAICLRCLKKSPDDRYPTAQALAEALSTFLAGGKADPRSRLAVVGGAVVAVALLGGVLVGVFATDSGKPAVEPPPVPPPAKEPAVDARGAEEQLAEAKRLRDPVQRLAALDGWLQQHPEHPARDDGRQLRAQILLRVPLRRFDHAHCSGVAFLPGDRALSTGGRVQLWDLEADRLVRTWRFDLPTYGSPWVQPGGKAFAVISFDKSSQDRKTVTVASCEKEEPMHVVTTGFDVFWAAWSPSGELLALAGEGPEVVIWNVRTGERRALLHSRGGDTSCLAFLDEDRLATGRGTTYGTGGDDVLAQQAKINELVVWDLSRERPARRLSFVARPTSVAVAPQGDRVVIACDGSRLALHSRELDALAVVFRGFETGTREGALRVKAHTNTIREVVWGARGERLLSFDRDSHEGAGFGELRLWSANGVELWRNVDLYQRIRDVDLDADGQRVLVAADECAELWDLHGLPDGR